MGDESSQTPGQQRSIRIDPDQPIRMKTGTLIAILFAVAAGVAVWMRLEAVVANQGRDMSRMAEDIREIKQYFGIREKPPTAAHPVAKDNDP